jgi:undecaprenyl diphosphate synthase
LDEQGVCLRHIGRLEQLPSHLQNKVIEAVKLTQANTRLTLNIAFNYGGRDEIIQAVQHMMQDGISADEVTPETFARYLYTAGIPDPDLIIRTSGELRISNFLIWQAAYSEWYVTPTYWPDFDKNEFHKALETYANRDRRYGKVSSTDYEEKHA